MTTEPKPDAMLLFTDAAGQGYLLPAAVLEQARLSEEQLAALREQLDEDVRGNVQDVGDRPVALQLGLQAVITNRQVLARLSALIRVPALQGFDPCI